MPFCPQCRSEYVDGITKCSDCDVDLVDQLPPDPNDPASLPNDELVTIFRGRNRAELDIVRSVLDDAGIPCIEEPDADMWPVTSVSRSKQEYRLTVPVSLAEQAWQAITAAIESGKSMESPGDP